MGRNKAKKFRCRPDDGWLGGVCAGLADYLGVEAWIVRLIWFVCILCAGIGLGIYLLLWIFVPNAEDDEAPAEPPKSDGCGGS